MSSSARSDDINSTPRELMQEAARPEQQRDRTRQRSAPPPPPPHQSPVLRSTVSGRRDRRHDHGTRGDRCGAASSAVRCSWPSRWRRRATLSPAQASSARAATSRAARPVTTTSARPAPARRRSVRPPRPGCLRPHPSPTVAHRPPSPAQASGDTGSADPPLSHRPRRPGLRNPPHPGCGPRPAPPHLPPAPRHPGSVLHLTFDDGPDPTWTPRCCPSWPTQRPRHVLRPQPGGRRTTGLVADRARGGSFGRQSTTTHPDLTKLPWPTSRRSGSGPRMSSGHPVRSTALWSGQRHRSSGHHGSGLSRATVGHRHPRLVAARRDVITQRIVDGARPGPSCCSMTAATTARRPWLRSMPPLTRLDAAGWRYEAIPGC